MTKKKSPAKKPLYAHVLLDRSGSMGSNAKQTIDAINEYVHSLALDAEIDAQVSITLFDSYSNRDTATGTNVDLVKLATKEPAATATKLDSENYKPRGNTPLNDAIGVVVSQIDLEARREGETVVLAIMTDGQENSSKEYTKEAVKALLDARRAKGWMVLYLGADHDAFAASAAYGIAAGQTMQFNKMDPHAHTHATMSMSRSTRSYAGGQSLDQASFTEDERKRSK